jgi:hypothetical protein
MTAHNCLLVALEVQEERFKIDGLQAAIQNAVRDWASIWSPGWLAKLETGAEQ